MTAEPFDPYYRWLGIRPEEQPPNHYRLLGLSPFESDPDVIDAAADKQTTFLRGCASGPHVALTQRLLKEIAAARLCLLNPEKKTAYDDALRRALEDAAAAAEPPPAAAGEPALDLDFDPSSPAPGGASSPDKHRRKMASWQAALIAVGVLLLLGAGAMVVLGHRGASTAAPPGPKVAAALPAGKTESDAAPSLKRSPDAKEIQPAPLPRPAAPAAGSESGPASTAKDSVPSPESPTSQEQAAQSPADAAKTPAASPAETGAPAPASTPAVEWISKDATYTPSSIGIFPWGKHTPLPSLLTDEGPRHFRDQFAFETQPEADPYILITLASPSTVYGFSIQNRAREAQQRAKGLTMWVSLDQQNWSKVWTAEKAEPEWRVDLPRPVHARYVKLGLEGKTQLHLRTVKLFGHRALDDLDAVAGNLPSPPDEDAQAKGMKLIREVYGEEYDAAKTVEQKKALARKLLGKGQESRDNPTAKYLLWKLARDVAVQATDGLTAFEAIDRMAEAFQIDAVEMKADVLSSLAKKARLPADHRAIAVQASELIEPAATGERFDVAVRLGSLALSEASAAHDSDLAKQLRARMPGVRERASACDEARRAIEKLKGQPNDPDANLAAGRYCCFFQGDWARGLPMLASSADASLKELAKKDLQGATSADEQVKIGDGWWSLAAESQGALPKRRTLERAAHWYNGAMPGLTGLMQSKIEKRLAECLPQVAEKDPDAAALGAPEALRRPKRVNGLQFAALDCTKTFYELAVGPRFDVRKSWTLCMELQIAALRTGRQMLFLWGDDRRGHDVICVCLDGRTLLASVTDCRTNETQELIHQVNDDAFGRLLKIAFCYDAGAPRIRLFVNDKPVQEAAGRVTPILDKPMPIRIGGAGNRYGERFYGGFRSCWLSNTVP